MTLYAGDIPHSTNRFVGVELDPTQILRCYKSLSRISWEAHGRATRVTLQMPNPRHEACALRVPHWM